MVCNSLTYTWSTFHFLFHNIFYVSMCTFTINFVWTKTHFTRRKFYRYKWYQSKSSYEFKLTNFNYIFERDFINRTNWILRFRWRKKISTLLYLFTGVFTKWSCYSSQLLSITFISLIMYKFMDRSSQYMSSMQRSTLMNGYVFICITNVNLYSFFLIKELTSFLLI